LVLLALFLLGGVVIFSISQSSYLQTKLAKYAAAYLSDELGAEVKIDKLEVDFFNKLTLNGFVVYDQRGDTLVSAESFLLAIERFNFRKNRFRLGEIRLTGADIRLKQLDSLGGMNADFLTRYFASDAAESDSTASTTTLTIRIGQASLVNSRFLFTNDFGVTSETGIDFNHLDARDINLSVNDFVLINDSLTAQIESSRFIERSGFALQNLAADFRLNSEGVFFEDLQLDLSGTSLRGDLAFLHNSWSDYQNFTTDVEWDAAFDESQINLEDLGYFTPQFYALDFPINISGKFSGTVANLKGRDMVVTAGNRSVLKGNMDLLGLPEIESTFIDFRIKQLSSNYSDIEFIGEQITNNSSIFKSLPVELERAGSIFFEGSFTGFTKDFVAYGSLITEAGVLNLDLNLKDDSLNNQLIYTGGLSARSFDIGRILDLPQLGEVNAALDVIAFSKETLVSADLDGEISMLEYAGYEYKKIRVDGRLSPNLFAGTVSCSDPNVQLNFDGIVDFTSDIPVFDFEANIFNMDLTALNLVKSAQPLSFSSTLTLNAQGKQLNTISGILTGSESFLCYGDTAVYIENFLFSAGGDERGRKISLTSDIVDLNLIGIFTPDELPEGFKQLIAQVLPSLSDPEKEKRLGPISMDFSLNYKAPNSISGMLFSGLEISQNTTVYGNIDNQLGIFGLFVRSGLIAYDGVVLRDLIIDAGKESEILRAQIHLSDINYKGFSLQNPDFNLEAYNDIVQLHFGWLNAENASYGDLDLQVTLIDSLEMIVDIRSGSVGADQSVWNIAQEARIWIVGDSIGVDSLALIKNDQRLSIDGTISRDPSSELQIFLERFDLADLDSIGIQMDSHFKGVANLNATVRQVYAEPQIRSAGSIIGLTLDDFLIGDIVIATDYSAEGLDMQATLSKDGNKLLKFEGDYLIGEEEPLQGHLLLDGFDLQLVNALELKDIRDFTGQASGDIAVEGTLQNPRLKGVIDFDAAKFTIDYLNTSFTFSDQVRVEDGWMGIDYKPLYDQEGNKGFVVASVFHDNFSNWTYDVSADVNDFLIVNTTRDMNSTYYGTARATGTLQIGGYESLVEIAIDARTEKGTSIKLPLDNTGEVTLENFVYFVARDEQLKESREADLTGVLLRLNLEVTPDAEVQLIFDEQTGDIIRGRGTGALTFEISPAGEFSMFGRYEVLSGNYLFTLQNLINKQFTVRPGGVIGWYGDPYQADIDISAAYNLRTPLFPIMIENKDRYRSREEINVVLNLSGKLMNPTINFSIELPQTTETERSQLASVVSTSQHLNQQVFALLILNRFLPVDQGQGADAGGFSGLGSATTSDFVSTQISNWLSEISSDFDIGINYRPGDQISNQEVAVALSTQLFNERLAVRGNFGVTQASELQSTQGQSGLVGDFLVEYMMTEEGTIRLKVFNETNPYEIFSTGSIYTQGVGLVYQEDFNTLDEFIKKIGELFSNDKARKVKS